ncbi:unnamed protein product [Mytilus edulis]|uniref:HTH CENPB-type domain-containing protein n=1 Tax=Mytilus edulis TaxID=6550 RepID=A0A8S3SX13_MYTED|nr:unnamed protein product [Mytilus edulis]
MSIRSASRQYNVPKTTSIDKLNGRSSLQARSGPSPVLFDSEEEMLVHWVIDMAKIGYGQTRQQLLYTVKTILDHDGRKTPFKDNLPDESGFPQDPKSGKILAAKGSKNVYSTCSADKSQITVLACMSATAHYLPPMLVFQGRFRFNPLEGFTEAVLGRTKTVESVDKSKVEPSQVFARAKPDQDLSNDDDMNCKDAQVDSRPVTNSSGTYNLDQEPYKLLMGGYRNCFNAI